MRIPTYVNSRLHSDTLTRQYDLVNRIQQKISSGKKLIDSSDDPVLSQSIVTSKDYINLLESYKNNIIMGKSRAKLVESSVTGSINAVSRAAELVKAAQSDTANNTDRQNMARELEGLLNTILGQMNSRDSNGDYIFAGTNSATQPFVMVNGSYQYIGSYDQSSINVGRNASTVYNENGQRVFGDMRQGNGVVTIHQGSIPNQGTAETSVSTITNSSAYDGDTFTLTFVTNSAGQVAYQVVGQNSGQIIPAPPQTAPADAPAYKAGEAINFSGISMVVQGNPSINDSFVVSPSQKQNILETIRQTINLLNTPVNNDVEKAAFHQKLGELSSGIDGAGSFLTHFLSEVGYREKELDNQDMVGQSEILNQKTILDKLESADMATLIPELQAATLSMELTQKAHSKLQDFFEQLLKNILS